MEIKKATHKDIDALMALFDEARGTIAALGIDQWQDGYPSRTVIEEDIALGRSYAVFEQGLLAATFVIVEDGEITYDRVDDGHWLTGDGSQSYLAIHRVAIALSHRGRGIAGAIMQYAREAAARLGRNSLRIDTHRGNVVMRRMLEKQGFTHCGTIYLQSGAERVAYEHVLGGKTVRKTAAT